MINYTDNNSLFFGRVSDDASCESEPKDWSCKRETQNSRLTNTEMFCRAEGELLWHLSYFTNSYSRISLYMHVFLTASKPAPPPPKKRVIDSFPIFKWHPGLSPAPKTTVICLTRHKQANTFSARRLSSTDTTVWRRRCETSGCKWLWWQE